MAIDQVVGALVELLGEERVITAEDELFVYECDGMTVDKAVPEAVVFPESSAEVAAIVKILHQAQIPFLARGAGTGLSGGAVAIAGGVIIALTRMNRILEIDLDNRRAVIEPGVVNIWLSKAVDKDGYYYVPDPSSQQACTIGGNVAENSGGPHTLKYGVTTNHVLGLEVVLPNGEIVELGGKQEEAVGYDLVGLMVGSEGTFGIVTKVIVRLTRLPQAYRTMLGIFETIDDATNTISDIIAAGIIPAALEMMDALTIEALEAAFKVGFPDDAGAVLIIELDGLEAGMAQQADQIIAICRQHQVREVKLANDPQERDLLWKSRKQAFGALGYLSASYYTQDGVVPRTKLPQIMRKIAEVSDKYDLRIANVFHAGDGNLHPCILYDERDPAQVEKVVAASTEILRACVEAGGSVTGEHGIGMEKNNYMPWLFNEADLDAMAKLKEVFNPDGLLNPGKIFPTAQGCMELRPGYRRAAM